MRSARVRALAVAAITAVGVCAIVASGLAQKRAPLPVEPIGASGGAIFPAFEGWGPHKDGSPTLLIGYFNRNKDAAIDIPIGPNNRIEPGGPDFGQPTHFETGRQWGVFAIQVPKDFGTKKFTWTLVVNNQVSTVTFWLNPPYWVDFFKQPSNGNSPPVIRFAPNGPMLTGPPVGIAQTLSGTVGRPVTLTLWASDAPATNFRQSEPAGARGATREPDPVAIIGGRIIGGPQRGGRSGGGGGGVGRGGGAAAPGMPDITVNWKRHRAPGTVTFAQERIPLVTHGDPALFVEATTTATFDAPGEYVLRAQVNDTSNDGGAGEQCCWTTAHVRVNVK